MKQCTERGFVNYQKKENYSSGELYHKSLILITLFINLVLKFMKMFIFQNTKKLNISL